MRVQQTSQSRARSLRREIKDGAMVEVHVSFVFPQSVDAVWHVLRDYGAIASWLPGASNGQIENGLKTDQVGAVRRFNLRPGNLIREKLLALSDADHLLQYLLLHGPLPLWNMIGELRVLEITETGGALVCWRAKFDADEADQVTCAGQLKYLYAEGLMNLRSLLKSGAGPR
jgi:hypothetical protein